MRSTPRCSTGADGALTVSAGGSPPSWPGGSPTPQNGTAAWLVTAAWTAMGLILWVLFPMTSTVLLPLCCVAPLAWYWATHRRLPRYPLSAVTAALILVAGYLLINATWSLSPVSAATTVALAFVMVASLHVVLHTLPDLDTHELRAMAVGTLAGLGLAGAVLCLEVFSDQSLRRHLMVLIPALQPPPQHMEMEADGLAELAPYLPNANVSVLTLMFWPAALLVSRFGTLRIVRRSALGAAAVAAATVLASEHATSQIAFVGAGVAFMLFRLCPKLAMPAVVAGWVVANLLVVPAASLLYSAEAYRIPWLAQSAQHRVVIWGVTANKVAQAPILGAGIHTARALHKGSRGRRELVPGTPFHRSTSLHSHNAYLQIWYEAGAVGAGMMLGLGLLVLWSLRTFAAEVQPYLAAAFATCALLMASAYSIWAPWFMASFSMVAVFAALGAALPRTCTMRPTSEE